MFRITTMLLFLLFSSNSLISGTWELKDSLFYYSDTPGYNYEINYMAIDCADTMNCAAIGHLGLVYPWNRVTTDGGETWFTTLKDTSYRNDEGYIIYIPAKANEIDYPDTNLCIVICDTGYYWRSTDKCRTWEKFKFNTDRKLKNIDFYDKNHGCIVSSTEAFLTTDGGDSWKDIVFADLDFEDSDLWRARDVSMPEPGIVIIVFYIYGDNEYFVMRSDDWGVKWTISDTISPRIGKIYFVDKNIGYGAGRKQSQPNSSIYYDVIQKTTDGGKTWELQLDTLVKNYYGLTQIYFTDENNGVAMSHWHVLYRTRDGGEHWIRDEDYNSSNVSWFLIDIALLGSTQKFLGVANSIGNITKFTGEENSVTDGFSNDIQSSLQIFPNPVPSGTPINIRYQIERPGSIEFRIYDCLGNETDAPYSIYSAAGAFTVTYTPDRDFPPGVYFLRIVSDDGVLSKEFVVE